MGLAGHNLRRREEEAREAANKATKEQNRPDTRKTDEKPMKGLSELQKEAPKTTKKASKQKTKK